MSFFQRAESASSWKASGPNGTSIDCSKNTIVEADYTHLNDVPNWYISAKKDNDKDYKAFVQCCPTPSKVEIEGCTAYCEIPKSRYENMPDDQKIDFKWGKEMDDCFEKHDITEIMTGTKGPSVKRDLSKPSTTTQAPSSTPTGGNGKSAASGTRTPTLGGLVLGVGMMVLLL